MYGNQYNPQYFQQQFDQAMNQYKSLYNQQVNYQNSFVGQYVNTYDEVEKAQVSMNGMPTMFVGDGIFWIKKFVNGQPYISAYKFESINNVGQPTSNNTSSNKVDDDIMKYLQGIEERLIKLERNGNNGNEFCSKSNDRNDGK